jgi:hypothetical protein
MTHVHSSCTKPSYTLSIKVKKMIGERQRNEEHMLYVLDEYPADIRKFFE